MNPVKSIRCSYIALHVELKAVLAHDITYYPNKHHMKKIRQGYMIAAIQSYTMKNLNTDKQVYLYKIAYHAACRN